MVCDGVLQAHGVGGGIGGGVGIGYVTVGGVDYRYEISSGIGTKCGANIVVSSSLG